MHNYVLFLSKYYSAYYLLGPETLPKFFAKFVEIT